MEIGDFSYGFYSISIVDGVDGPKRKLTPQRDFLVKLFRGIGITVYQYDDGKVRDDCQVFADKREVIKTLRAIRSELIIKGDLLQRELLFDLFPKNCFEYETNLTLVGDIEEVNLIEFKRCVSFTLFKKGVCFPGHSFGLIDVAYLLVKNNCCFYVKNRKKNSPTRIYLPTSFFA